MTIRPLHDRVLVRRLPRSDRRFSNLIHVPDNYRGEFQEDATEHYGEVVAVGPGRRMVEGPKGVAGKFLYKPGGRRPVAVKPGDRVWWGRFSDWVQDGLEIIMEMDIIAVEDSDAVAVAVAH